MSKLSDLFQENKFTEDDIASFEKKVFFEGDRQRPYLVRFVVLLFLSTVIAAYGVINDSTATVIGAMIIAPLMTPIMAEAAAIVMGDRNRALYSLAIVVGGVLLVIVVSMIIGWIELQFSYISYSDNGQITGRVSPRITDLIVALASGTAGAFAMSRDDISDSMPGVAISISLVPPLCVVGICLAGTEWSAAWGAFLLFLTNYLSILLSGGIVLALLGLHKAANVDLNRGERRRSFAVIIIGVILVSLPLLATSLRVAREATVEAQTTTAATEWIDGSDYELRKVKVQGEEVDVLIAGEGDPPQISDLVDQLKEMYNSQRMLDVQIIPLQNELRRVIPTDE